MSMIMSAVSVPFVVDVMSDGEEILFSCFSHHSQRHSRHLLLFSTLILAPLSSSSPSHPLPHAEDSLLRQNRQPDATESAPSSP